MAGYACGVRALYGVMAEDLKPPQYRSAHMPIGEILWMIMMGLILLWGWGYIDSFRRK